MPLAYQAADSLMAAGFDVIDWHEERKYGRYHRIEVRIRDGGEGRFLLAYELLKGLFPTRSSFRVDEQRFENLDKLMESESVWKFYWLVKV
jgi:hypothetical protein